METNKPNDTETLMEGDLQVTLIGGATETVRIRQLAINQMPELLRRLDDEASMAELYADKPAGWAATLAPSDYIAVITRGDDLNAGFFSRWLARRLKRQELLLPGITQKLVGLPLPSSSPKLP